MKNTTDILEQKILSLEQELQEKNSLLLIYKEEIARINAKIEQLVDQKRSELDMANKIHELLVPSEMPNIPGFEFSSKFKASTKAGGDYFEIIQHEEKYKFAVLMASSSGYAMSALFLSMLLKMTGRIATRSGFSPIEFIEKIYTDTKKQMSPDDDLSLVYAVIDRKKSTIQYTGCGNLSIMHWDSQNSEVQTLPLETEKISKKSNLSFSQEQISFSPEDRFLFASRGILEQENPRGNPYKSDHLKRILHNQSHDPIHQTRNEVFIDLERYSNKTDMLRDWTLLLIGVKSNLVKLSLK